MQHVIDLMQRSTAEQQNSFAANLAALFCLCFAGYLGLLVF